MKKLAPPAHIFGPMPNDAPDDLKLERAKWIAAQASAGYSTRRIATALNISPTTVRGAAAVGRELAPAKQTIGLPRASWEDLRPAPRHETEPRPSLARTPPPDRQTQSQIDKVIGFIRQIHAEFMAAEAKT
ncbi:hypothetical protein [Paracoccus cavernae]